MSDPHEGHYHASEGFIVTYCYTLMLTIFLLQLGTASYCNAVVDFRFQWDSIFTMMFARQPNSAEAGCAVSRDPEIHAFNTSPLQLFLSPTGALTWYLRDTLRRDSRKY